MPKCPSRTPTPPPRYEESSNGGDDHETPDTSPEIISGSTAPAHIFGPPLPVLGPLAFVPVSGGSFEDGEVAEADSENGFSPSDAVDDYSDLRGLPAPGPPADPVSVVGFRGPHWWLYPPSPVSDDGIDVRVAAGALSERLVIDLVGDSEDEIEEDAKEDAEQHAVEDSETSAEEDAEEVLGDYAVEDAAGRHGQNEASDRDQRTDDYPKLDYDDDV